MGGIHIQVVGLRGWIFRNHFLVWSMEEDPTICRGDQIPVAALALSKGIPTLKLLSISKRVQAEGE